MARLKALKLAAAALAALLVVVAAVASVGAWLGDRKLQRRTDVRVVPVPFTSDPAAIRLGRELYETRGCAQCHGARGAGGVAAENATGLYVRAPNLTKGERGVVSAYTEGDWVRALRHGVNPSGRALLFMPSEEYNRLTDAELAAIVAFVRNLPPVDGEAGVVRLPFHLKALYGLGLMQDATERIDHRKPPPA